MKKTYRLKAGLSRITPTDLLEKGRGHLACCTGDPDLQLPPDLLTRLAAACDALEMANIAVSDNGGRKDTLIRAHRVWDVRLLIRKLSGYVSAQCGEDGERLLRAGFALHKAPQRVGILDAPQELRAKRGELPGEVKLRWKGIKGRTQYVLEMNAGDPNNHEEWQRIHETGKNYCTITDLVTDKAYSFRVSATSTAGEGVLSDLATSKAA